MPKYQRRAKGGGSVFKRPNGHYCVQYKNLDGKLKTVTLKDEKGLPVTSKVKAEEYASKELEDYFKILHADTKEKHAAQVAEYRGIIKKANLKLSDCWELFLKNTSRPDSSEGTLGNHKCHWDKFLSWLNGTHPKCKILDDVTGDMASEYFEYLWGTKVSAGTFNYYRISLNLICKTLVKSSSSGSNPFACITKKADSQQSRSELTESEVMKVLNLFSSSDFRIDHKEQLEVMFYLGVYTGLRLIDCALMEHKSINYERNLITTRPRKTERTTQTIVSIPIHPELLRMLNKASAWRKNDYLLPDVADRYNAALTSDDVTTIFQAAGFETSKALPNVQRKLKACIYGFHSFRHTFVSICAKNNVPLPIVQAIVGHNNPAITRHYIHMGEENLKQAIKTLPGPVNSSISDQDSLHVMKAKIAQVLELLAGKHDLTEREKHIQKVLR